MERTLATTTRPNAMKTPESCGASVEPVASRVIGRLSAKITTPMKPMMNPRRMSGAATDAKAGSLGAVGSAVVSKPSPGCARGFARAVMSCESRFQAPTGYF